MPGLNLTRLEQDFGSTQPNPKPFEVFSGTGARGSDAFFLPIKVFQVTLTYANKLKTVLIGTILLKFVGKRDEILSICKKDVIGYR